MSYYFICFILSVILSIIYIYKWHNRYNVFFTLLYVFVPVTNLGYWQLSIATELKEAILANKIQYLGACFTPLVVLLSIIYICHIKLPKIIEVAMFLFTMTIYAGVLTVGYNGLFYKDVAYEFVSGKYMLIKEYGPLHTVYYFMLGGYLIIGIATLIYAVIKKQDVPLKSAILLFTINLVTVIAFAVGRAVGGVELTAICYDIALFIFLVVTDRLVLYSVDETVISAFMNSGDIGVASFDLKRNFLGCNEVAKKFYPPLGKLYIDRNYDLSDPELKELSSWIEGLESDKRARFEYENGDKYYRIAIEHLYDGKKVRGYNLIFRDHTEDHEQEKYLEQIAITDELTAVYNRRAFDDDIALMTYQGLPDDLIIVSIDLNGLKRANDSLGHAAGDELITGAANCLRKVFMKDGKLYRTGGDEFTAVLQCSLDKLKVLFTELDSEVASWKGVYVDSMTMAYGAASRKEFPDLSVEMIEKEADQRMYQNKSEYYKKSGLGRRRVDG